MKINGVLIIVHRNIRIFTKLKTDFNQAKVEAMGQNKPIFWFFLVGLVCSLYKTG
jgi:hypothetical protein